MKKENRNYFTFGKEHMISDRRIIPIEATMLYQCTVYVYQGLKEFTLIFGASVHHAVNVLLKTSLLLFLLCVNINQIRLSNTHCS